MVPLADGRLYCFACVNPPRNNLRCKRSTVRDLYERHKNFRHPVPDILKATEDGQLLWNDVICLPPLEGYVNAAAVLVGDAAHAATPPNMGKAPARDWKTL